MGVALLFNVITKLLPLLPPVNVPMVMPSIGDRAAAHPDLPRPRALIADRQHVLGTVAPGRGSTRSTCQYPSSAIDVGHQRVAPLLNHHRPGPFAICQAVAAQARDRRRIVDGRSRSHPRYRSHWRRRSSPIARRAHLRPRRAAGLVPRPERQGRRTRPVVVGIRRKIQPRAGVVR